MIYITQLIYLKEGQQEIFHQFEEVAIPLISKYNGHLLLRVRPGGNDIVAHNMDVPYEIHLVDFETEQDFRNFMADEERKKYVHLKEASIKSVVLIRGEAI